MNVARALALLRTSPARALKRAVTTVFPPRRFFSLGVSVEMINRCLRQPHLLPDGFFAMPHDDLLARAQSAARAVNAWTSDSIHGHDWGLAPSSRIRIVEGREIKVPWELSRFHDAPVLAFAYRESGDARYLDSLLAQITDWIEKNPLQRGPNWMNAMEAAIRSMNWCAALDIARSSLVRTQPPDRYHAKLAHILMSLDEHGWFVEKHLEYGGANHEIAGMAGLVFLGAFLAGTSSDAGRWFSVGKKGLEQCMAEQVYEDGADYESSIAYHGFALELFSIGALVCRQHGAPVSSGYLEKLWRMVDFYHQCNKPNGARVNFGDNDGGRVFSVSARDMFATVLWPDRPLPNHASRFFKNAQIAIMRSNEIFCAVDAGPNGQGSVGGHCHNDVLSFELSVSDRAFIIDPGTGVYTFDTAMRNRFRSSTMHATVAVDGEEQNRIPARELFLMRDDACPVVIEWKSDENRDLFIAEHYGYRRLSDPVTHRRSFELLKGDGRLVITDEFFCDREHFFEWNFPLHPDVKIEKDGEFSFRFVSGSTRLMFSFDSRLVVEVVEIPFSASYGMISATRAIRFVWKGSHGRFAFIFK